jgi:hypothetical protein
VFAAGSIAATAKEWVVPAPPARPVRFTGLVQGAPAPPSTEHTNVEPPSFELNVNVAEVEFVVATGLLSIVVSGGVMSSVIELNAETD